jgi:hypothetical protein
LSKIKPVFDRIRSCSVWKFCSKSKSALFYRAQPSSLLPRPIHARSPAHMVDARPATASTGRAPCRLPAPPPLTSSSSAWRDRARAPPLLLPLRGTAHVGPLTIFPFSLSQKPSTSSISPFCSVAVFGTEARQHPFLPSPPSPDLRRSIDVVSLLGELSICAFSSEMGWP